MRILIEIIVPEDHLREVWQDLSRNRDFSQTYEEYRATDEALAADELIRDWIIGGWNNRAQVTILNVDRRPD